MERQIAFFWFVYISRVELRPPDELMARVLTPLHRSTSAFNNILIILDPS